MNAPTIDSLPSNAKFFGCLSNSIPIKTKLLVNDTHNGILSLGSIPLGRPAVKSSQVGSAAFAMPYETNFIHPVANSANLTNDSFVSHRYRRRTKADFLNGARFVCYQSHRNLIPTISHKVPINYWSNKRWENWWSLNCLICWGRGGGAWCWRVYLQSFIASVVPERCLRCATLVPFVLLLIFPQLHYVPRGTSPSRTNEYKFSLFLEHLVGMSMSNNTSWLYFE